MPLTVPKKRAFRNVFRPSHTQSYKPGGQDPVRQERRTAERQRRRLAGQPIRNSAPGSNTVLLVISLIVVRALREIHYWQSEYTAAMLCIPHSRFALLCREIQQDVVLRDNAGVPGSFKGDFRWEKDTLLALQLMTEHLLVMFFEMTYFFFYKANTIANVSQSMQNVLQSFQKTPTYFVTLSLPSIQKTDWGDLLRNARRPETCIERRKKGG